MSPRSLPVLILQLRVNAILRVLGSTAQTDNLCILLGSCLAATRRNTVDGPEWLLNPAGPKRSRAERKMKSKHEDDRITDDHDSLRALPR
jgi:hypothetical protein